MRTATTTETIWAVADRDGTLVDTGFTAGERVIVTLRPGHQHERIVVGPAPQPYESIVYDGPAWGRKIKAEPALQCRQPEARDLVLSVPVSWLSRVADDAVAS